MAVHAMFCPDEMFAGRSMQVPFSVLFERREMGECWGKLQTV